MKINIGFETYSTLDLKKVGVYKYTHDASTEIRCLAYSIDENEPDIWLPGEQFPFTLKKAIDEKYLVYAFDAELVMSIWETIGIVKHNFPAIDFKLWRDIKAKALCHSYPDSLKDCGKALGLDLQKNKDCKQGIKAEIAINNAFPIELSENELRIWRNTVIKNNFGLPIDVELVDAILDITETYVADMSALIPTLTQDAVTSINQNKKIVSWAKSLGYDLPDLSKETVKLHLEEPDINDYPEVKTILLLRQLIGKSSVKKYKTIKMVTCEDGRARSCFQHHTASTGREGGKLIQPHNLPNAKIHDIEKTIYDFKNLSYDEIISKYENIMHIASALIRSTIRAPKGKKFIIADYTSIELIKLCWLAGQNDILDLIKKGFCPYTDMAANIYNKAYNEITDERQFGKEVILGGQYCMGYKTFKINCVQRGIAITDKEATDYIRKYRKKYNKVVQFWGKLENAAIEATLYPGRLVNAGYINFLHKYDFLFMFLPNGKPIMYPQARVVDSKKSWGNDKVIMHMGLRSTKNNKTKKWTDLYLNTTRLVENATQGAACQIQMEACCDLSEQGHDVFISVHDEIGVETTAENGLTVDELIEIMCNRSDYFKGMPLFANGFETQFYKKG